MGAVLSKPKAAPAPEPVPPPEPPPPPPERSSEEVAALADQQRRRFLSRRGSSRGNLATGASGISESGQSAAVALLGGVR